MGSHPVPQPSEGSLTGYQEADLKQFDNSDASRGRRGQVVIQTRAEDTA